ncbi:MAG: SEL1-like repeat protein [Ignavibacteriota bacterium]
MLYESGLGVPMDPGKATEWYKKAADGNSDDARVALKSLAEKK